MHERGDRSVAVARDLGRLAVDAKLCGKSVAAFAGVVTVRDDRVRRVDREVARAEDLVDLLRRELAALCVGDRLHLLREVDLEPARQLEPVAAREQEGDTALSRL